MADGENPAIEAAQEIGFDEIEEALLAEQKLAQAENPTKEPDAGSYERFLTMFGGVRQA